MIVQLECRSAVPRRGARYRIASSRADRSMVREGTAIQPWAVLLRSVDTTRSAGLLGAATVLRFPATYPLLRSRVRCFGPSRGAVVLRAAATSSINGVSLWRCALLHVVRPFAAVVLDHSGVYWCECSLNRACSLFGAARSSSGTACDRPSRAGLLMRSGQLARRARAFRRFSARRSSSERPPQTPAS
jgi:hypothetical protein